MKNGSSAALPPMLILCGGLGTRLRSVVSDRPKPMVEVGGRPFLEHLIEYYRAQGVSRFLLCAGYLGEVIAEHFRAHLDVDVRIESTPLGTAGSVAGAAQQLDSTEYLVCNGDSFCAVELEGLHEITRANEALATLAVSRVANTGDYGTLHFDARGALTCFQEKPPLTEAFCWVNAGVYCFSRALLPHLPVKGGSLERDVFPRLIDTGRLFVMPIESPVLDIGTPQRLAGAAIELKRIREHQRELP